MGNYYCEACNQSFLTENNLWQHTGGKYHHRESQRWWKKKKGPYYTGLKAYYISPKEAPHG